MKASSYHHLLLAESPLAVWSPASQERPFALRASFCSVFYASEIASRSRNTPRQKAQRKRSIGIAKECHETEKMDGSFIMEFLVVIKVTEPRFPYPDFRKAH